MNEIDKLLNELREFKIKDDSKNIPNSKETWNKIGNRDLESLGFTKEEELKEWMSSNPYTNLI